MAASFSESFIRQCMDRQRRKDRKKHRDKPESRLRDRVISRLARNPLHYAGTIDTERVNHDVKANARKKFLDSIPESWREPFALERSLHGNEWSDREVLNLVAMHINSNINYYKTYVHGQAKREDDRKADLVDSLTAQGKEMSCETCTHMHRHMGGNPHVGTCDVTSKPKYMSESCKHYLPDSTRIYSL